MTTSSFRLNFLARRVAVLVALCLGASAALASTADPELQFALDGIWQLERPGISTLSDQLQRKDGVEPARFESDVRNALAYVHAAAEGAEVEFARKRFSAVQSPWGALPRLDMSTARLIEVTLPRKRYLVLSATGEGLFRIGDWQRFGFLHVVDASQNWAPVHYPLVAEAGLRERVIGRLPGSPVLNYLRLVPKLWRDAGTIDAYEVLVYALNPKGPERVRDADGHEINYLLSRDNEDKRWQLSRLANTEAAIARDAAGAAFSAPQLASAREPAADVPTISTPEPSHADESAAVSAHAISSASSASPAMETPEPAKHGPDAQPAKAEAEARALAQAEDQRAAKPEPQALSSAEAAAKSKARDEAERAASDSAAAAMKKKFSGLH